MSNKHSLKVGDSVLVKPGVSDSDTGIDFSDWQGRVIEINESEEHGVVVDIAWDSITLQNMPTSFIIDCKRGGYQWSGYYLAIDDIESTEPRDKESYVSEIREKLENRLTCYYLGEEGQAISEMMINADLQLEPLEVWEHYLKQTLTFPFEAEVDYSPHGAPLQEGDQISVKRISQVDDHYGLIVALRKGELRYYLPLCDLTPLDPNSPNDEPIYLYSVWFANG